MTLFLLVFGRQISCQAGHKLYLRRMEWRHTRYQSSCQCIIDCTRTQQASIRVFGCCDLFNVRHICTVQGLQNRCVCFFEFYLFFQHILAQNIEVLSFTNTALNTCTPLIVDLYFLNIIIQIWTKATCLQQIFDMTL